MVDTLQFLGLIVALVLGSVAVIEAGGKPWAGWGVVLMALVLLLPELERLGK